MLPSLDQHEVPVSVAVVVHDEAWSVQAYSQRQQLTVEHQSLHHAMGAIQATAEGQCLGPFPAVLMSPKNLRSTGQVDLRCWLKGVQHNKALTPYGPGNYLLVLFERVRTQTWSKNIMSRRHRWTLAQLALEVVTLGLLILAWLPQLLALSVHDWQF